MRLFSGRVSDRPARSRDLESEEHNGVPGSEAADRRVVLRIAGLPYGKAAVDCGDSGTRTGSGHHGHRRTSRGHARFSPAISREDKGGSKAANAPGWIRLARAECEVTRDKSAGCRLCGSSTMKQPVLVLLLCLSHAGAQ